MLGELQVEVGLLLVELEDPLRELRLAAAEPLLEPVEPLALGGGEGLAALDLADARGQLGGLLAQARLLRLELRIRPPRRRRLAGERGLAAVQLGLAGDERRLVGVDLALARACDRDDALPVLEAQLTLCEQRLPRVELDDARQRLLGRVAVVGTRGLEPLRLGAQPFLELVRRLLPLVE